MALPSSGAISLNQVNVELGRSGTTTISMNETAVRTLFGVASGGISMSNGYGKSNRASISYTFSASTANASLNLSALGGYVSGKTDFTVTINSGVYLYATSTGNYGLSLSGATSGDTVTIVNNGFIMGQGGDGGRNAAGASTQNPGGPALNIGTGINVTINNTNGSAYIGGGGGGGGQCTATTDLILAAGGGGAGGGAGGSSMSYAGGAGGGIGSAGGTGTTLGGGGGGRIFPGTGGASRTTTTMSENLPGFGGGSGGSGAAGASSKGTGNNGTSGAGGSANQAGGTGTETGTVASQSAGGGGGGWGASGGTSSRNITGGPGGKAVNLNGKTVTWVSGNTSRVYGAVS